MLNFGLNASALGLQILHLHILYSSSCWLAGWPVRLAPHMF